MPTYFWGIGYDSASHDGNKTKYLQLNAEIRASFDYHIFESCYFGPILHFNYMQAKDATLCGTANRFIHSIMVPA